MNVDKVIIRSMAEEIDLLRRALAMTNSLQERLDYKAHADKVRSKRYDYIEHTRINEYFKEQITQAKEK